jgi:hypothetical protein
MSQSSLLEQGHVLPASIEEAILVCGICNDNWLDLFAFTLPG